MKHWKSDLYIIIINAFFFIPIVAVVFGSFNQNRSNTSWEGTTLEWYRQLLQDASLIKSLQNTILLAVISMLLAVLFGTLAAFGIYRFAFRGKKLIDTMFYIPVVIPEVVLGISLMVIFSVFQIPSGLLTLVIAHTTFCIPYVVFNVKAAIAGFDPSIEEASMDLGATRVQTFMKITIPVIMPGVFSGAYMSFTLSIDDIIVSSFTNGPGFITLPIMVNGMTKRGIDPDVYSLFTIIMLVVLVVVLMSQLNWNSLMRKIFHRQEV